MPTWILVALVLIYAMWSILEISAFTGSYNVNKRRKAKGLSIISYSPMALTITVSWLVITLFLISYLLIG